MFQFLFQTQPVNKSISRFTGSLFQSATLLLQTHQEYQENIPVNDFLAVAPGFGRVKDLEILASVLPDAFIRNDTLIYNDFPVAAIPYTINETDDVAKLFKKSYNLIERFTGRKLKIIKNRTATELSFRSDSELSYKYIHLATHGIFDENTSNLSRLLFTPGDTSKVVDDGSLLLPELYALDIHADLVVLSACATASGEWVSGEGLIGLTRGFFYAGAKNVIYTLFRKLMDL